MSIEDLYNSIFYLYSDATTGRDAIGGVVRTVVLKQSTIPCYITYLDGQEQYIYGKTNVVANHRLFCAPLPISSVDVIRIIDDDGDNWYDIVHIDDCEDLQHHYEILLIGIDAPQEILESSSDSSQSNSYSSSSSSSESSTITHSSTSSRSSSSSSTSSLDSSSSSISSSLSSSSET